MNMGRAYCNLGLAHLALGQLDTSLECQKYFLAIAHMTNNSAGRLHELKLAIFHRIELEHRRRVMKMEEKEEAIKMYHRQWQLQGAAETRAWRQQLAEHLA
nr:unnamed protein product [Callosobruchus analis]